MERTTIATFLIESLQLPKKKKKEQGPKLYKLKSLEANLATYPKINKKNVRCILIYLIPIKVADCFYRKKKKKKVADCHDTKIYMTKPEERSL